MGCLILKDHWNLSVVRTILDECERSGVKSKGDFKKKILRVRLPLPVLRAGAVVEKEASCLRNSWYSSWQPELTVRTQTFLGIRSPSLWRKTRLCAMSVAVNLAALCCYLRSGSVARQQLQRRNADFWEVVLYCSFFGRQCYNWREELGSCRQPLGHSVQGSSVSFTLASCARRNCRNKMSGKEMLDNYSWILWSKKIAFTSHMFKIRLS